MAVMTPFFDIVAGVAILAGRSSLLDTKVFKTGGSNFTLRHLLGLGFVGYGGWHLWKVEQAQDKLKESLEAESFAASAKIKVCGNCGTKEGQEWGDFDEDSYDEWGDCRWCAWGVDPEDQKTIGLCDDCDGVWTDVDVRVEYTEHGESCSNPKCAGYERRQEAESFAGESFGNMKYSHDEAWPTGYMCYECDNESIVQATLCRDCGADDCSDAEDISWCENCGKLHQWKGLPDLLEDGSAPPFSSWFQAESFGAELQGNSYMIINEDDGSQTVIDAYLNDDEGLDISVSDGEDTEYGGINFDKNRLPKGISLSNDTKDWTRHYRLSDLGKDEGHELERWYAESFADEDTALPEHIKTELRDQHGISKGEKSLLKLLRKPKEEKADVSVHHQLPDAAFQKSLGDYDLTQYEESEAESFAGESFGNMKYSHDEAWPTGYMCYECDNESIVQATLCRDCGADDCSDAEDISWCENCGKLHQWKGLPDLLEDGSAPPFSSWFQAESFGAELQGNSYMIINEDDGSQTVIDAYLNDDEGLDISVSDGEDTEYGGINFDKNRLPKGISLSNDTKDWTRHYRLSDLGKDEGHELERWYAESFADEDTALPEHIKTELRDQHGISKGEKSLLKLLRKPKEEKADVSVHHQLPDAAFQKSLGDYDLTQYEESEAESFGVEGDDYETASAIQKIRYWARLGITDKGYGDKGKFQNIVKICDSLLEENNAESFSADSFELETDSGHEVQWDDGSFYMTFKEPIDGYGEANGHWYGGERESPDEILLDVEPAWDEETDDEYDVPSLHIQVSQVEYYGIENHNMSVSPDGVASPELLDAIQEGLAWMVDDHEDKTVVSREYRGESFTYGESSPQHKEGFTPIGVYDVEGVGLCTGVSFAEEQAASSTGKPPVFFEWAYICDTCTYEEDECECGLAAEGLGAESICSFENCDEYTLMHMMGYGGAACDVGVVQEMIREGRFDLPTMRYVVSYYERNWGGCDDEVFALLGMTDAYGAESFAAMSEEAPIVP